MKGTKKWFSNQFKAGNRWVVLDLLDSALEDSICYANYLDAAEDCRDWNARGGRHGVRVLASLLKEMNGNLPAPCRDGDIDNLKRMLDRYRLSRFPAGIGWEAELLNGNYYPFIMEQMVHPLLKSKKFVILRELASRPVKYQELCRADDFPKAMVLFYNHAASIREEKASLILAGQFLEWSVDYSKHSFEDGRVAIALYRMQWGDSTGPDIVEVHDPCVPVLRKFVLFARYDPNKRMLRFYDGGLKRIHWGGDPGLIDLDVFDFRNKVF